jgi:alpha-L-fucosidase
MEVIFLKFKMNSTKVILKRIFIVILLSRLIGGGLQGQVVVDSTLLLSDQDMQWWRNAKFGLFVHYGLYAILGKGEWAMFSQPVDAVEYAKLKDQFFCEKFHGKDWVEVAKNAGCKYMVVTARHHDGFCLFGTHFGNYDAVNSAAKKDLIAEYAEAAHQANMKMGIYYSPLDWRYPGFFFPDMYRSNAEEMKKQTYTQVRELLTNYGKVDILWYDGGEDNWIGFGGLLWDPENGWHTRGFEKPYLGSFSWEPLKLNKMVRELQPKVVINPRSGWMGDFQIQEVGLKGKINDRPWELCTNLGGTAWGWTPKSADQIMSLDSCIKLLVTVVCQDGNLLLNVGPKASGEIEPVQVQRLKEIGDYLSKYGESIYNTRGGMYDAKWGGTTITDEAVYVHILKVPPDGTISLPLVKRKIISSKFMNDNKKAEFVQTGEGIKLTNLIKHNETDLIVKLAVKKETAQNH